MEQEEGSDGVDDDFPHSFFFVRYLCGREDCYGMLAPLPPLPNGDLSHVFECNACGQLKKEGEDDDDDEPDAGDSNMVN
jgi:SET and MYND domain-containing protein